MRANTLPDALCRNIKIWPVKGRGLGHVTEFEILGSPFISSERLKIEAAYLVQHVLAIVWQTTPNVGVVRSRDLNRILQYNVNVGNKKANINVKTCHFKTWCKGDKSSIENSTDHFCEDTRQNALAALTNLGHVTPSLLLGPPHHLTIQWVR